MKSEISLEELYLDLGALLALMKIRTQAKMEEVSVRIQRRGILCSLVSLFCQKTTHISHFLIQATGKNLGFRKREKSIIRACFVLSFKQQCKTLFEFIMNNERIYHCRIFKISLKIFSIKFFTYLNFTCNEFALHSFHSLFHWSSLPTVEQFKIDSYFENWPGFCSQLLGS